LPFHWLTELDFEFFFALTTNYKRIPLGIAVVLKKRAVEVQPERKNSPT
jgi:hypothetical protein